MGTVVFDVGYAIPLETFDGDTAALTDYVGTPLLLNFWASCARRASPRCRTSKRCTSSPTGR